MCSSCGKSSVTTPAFKKVAAKVADTNCTLIKEDIILIEDRLKCFKLKFPEHPSINSYMGIVQSMLNLSQYCRYDLQPILDSLDGSTC